MGRVKNEGYMRNSESKQDTRAALLAAGIALLAKGGVSAVQARDLSKMAGCAHSAITRLFGSKDILLQEAIETVVDATHDLPPPQRLQTRATMYLLRIKGGERAKSSSR